MPLPTFTPPPSAPSRLNPVGYPAAADAMMAWLPTNVAEMTVGVSWMNDTANTVAAQASAAVGAIGAAVWVSGTNYAVYDVKISPITFLAYRRKTSGGGVIDPSMDATNWQLVLGHEQQTVRDWGAIPDGSTNARAAFALADSLGPFVVPAGSYYIASSLAITSAVHFKAGAKLVIPNGVTVTLNGSVYAEAMQIFQCTGSGAVVVDGRATPTGWAEWWGLTRESSGAAASNLSALNAALIALRETRLLPATYYVSGEININLAGHRLKGAGGQYDGTNEGRITRIISTSATGHILYMGATSFTSIGALPRGIQVSDLYLSRSVAPNVPAQAAGLISRYNLFSEIRNVKSVDSIHCFQFSGTVHLKVFDCHAHRQTAGSGGSDLARGFFIDGNTSIGTNGGNASLYLHRCNAEGGIPIANSIGFLADHKMTDLFILEPETSNFTTGIEISGDSSNTTYNNDNTNIQIIHPILDTFTYAGIYIHGLNKYGSLEIRGGYYGPAAGATAAVHVVSNLSAVRVCGGQFLMGAQVSAFGVRVYNSSNVIIDGSMIDECTEAAVVLDGASNCRITPLVKNNSKTCDVAVKLFNTCTANLIAPTVSGGASKVTTGISVIGTGDARNEYNCTGIDSGCINTGSGNKLVRNSVQIVSAGTSGTNLVSGIMA